MKTHNLKTWPAEFAQVLSGRKTYEIRKDDRGFAVGDLLHLQEWQPREDHPDRGWYTGRDCWREVTYMTRGREWGLPAGLCVMALSIGAGQETRLQWVCGICGPTGDAAGQASGSQEDCINDCGGLATVR